MRIAKLLQHDQKSVEREDAVFGIVAFEPFERRFDAKLGVDPPV